MAPQNYKNHVFFLPSAFSSSQQQPENPGLNKGVAECGKETNSHFFFFRVLPDTLPPSTFLI